MKTWAFRDDSGVLVELASLPDELVPGQDVFTADFAARMTDVTSVDPAPQIGWVTKDGGQTWKKGPAPVVKP